ncbi:hypothetical protein [Hymenobacter jeollabukensis]|uniref:Uncharacterized protein n=1 Tax=Hymenobacter jeollabukensis TaxID=2025313 RepID=A0A5R8WJI9_9BACT|nr:hypothetical protein [Hymenobacter jeollabukensis]TLM88664.1 hypothetical protein FDY95_22780 [Hymenobacter jeollabukensis]
MTDVYLQSLGFSPLREETRASRPAFERAWRYRHEFQAQDGTSVFIEHPFGIDRCRMSTLEAPLRRQDLLADLALQDRSGLEAALAAFYRAHGGVGDRQPIVVVNHFRPYRRQR